jgi:integrase
MTPAKTIAVEGASRERIRVYQEGDLIRVRWREAGKRMTRSWPMSAENKATAKAFAKGIALGREAHVEKQSLTLRELWVRYIEAEFPHLRPNSQRLYREHWAKWEATWGRGFPAENTTIEMLIQFRTAMTKQGKAITTMREIISSVKRVYKWAAMLKAIPTNEIALYEFKVAKDAKKAPPAEYRTDEFQKILAKLDPDSASQWRAFVALSICGFQGARQQAVLHLRWEDIDFAAGVITWRAKWDKMGREWSQPLREATRKALAPAVLKRKDSLWVLPSGSSKNTSETYSIQSLWAALRAAEIRAGVEYKRGRGAHGLRRMLAGDVSALTGDATLGMMAIGDTDIRMAGRYIQKRDDRMAEVFTQLDADRES